MIMRLYNASAGVIAEQDNKFYVLEEDWDTLINRDDLYSYLKKMLPQTDTVDHRAINDLLPPIGCRQELWACGVTYLRSKVGRQEESKHSGSADFYGRVYEAVRPECFFKCNPGRIAGHKGFVRIRKDSTWDVPEPELTLVVTTSGKIIGYTIGNDMSSRSIEGENPLYLPQAKTYDGCASLGPCVYVSDEPFSRNNIIHLKITRGNSTEFEESISISQMKRSFEELVKYVYLECSFPFGCLIMTGTGIVPPASFTLQSGDVININIDQIGELTNTVR
jgi:2-dehydro-3-deoxy-D-arabinonate dehydratase